MLNVSHSINAHLYDRGRFMSNEPQSKWTTFYLATVDKNHLLERYTFYVNQARQLIFSQFSDIEGAVNRYSEEWYEEAGKHFDPDSHNYDDFVEQATEKGIEYGLMLEDMRDDVYLAILAGLYHRWEKDLRVWVVKELSHWLDRKRIEQKLWAVNLPTLIQLLESLGINIENQPFYPLLETLSKVVNVYKHGDGNTFNILKISHPEYFRRNSQDIAEWKYVSHEDLVVNEDQFNEFVDTLHSFWNCIPSYTSSEDAREEIPEWFMKLIVQD